MSPLNLVEVAVREKKAHEMVHNLCKPRNTEGARDWTMSIPVRIDHDPDVVIGVSLRDIPNLIDELKAARELLWGSRCVYCGEIVGKDRQNQDIADDVLRKHVDACPKHPLAQAKADLKALNLSTATDVAFIGESLVLERGKVERMQCWIDSVQTKLGISDADRRECRRALNGDGTTEWRTYNDAR